MAACCAAPEPRALPALPPPAASDGNVKYLGRSGVAAVGGLQVAFLDGTYSAPVFRSPEAAGGGAKGPGCRYYMESGGCCRSP